MPLVCQILSVIRHIGAGTLVEFQADVTQLTGKIRQIPTHTCSACVAGQGKDDKTTSFQRRAPFAMNPFVAAWLKPLKFCGFDASDMK